MPLTPLQDEDPVSLGPYALLGRLGQGGMGTVYLGLDEGQRAVAVKVLRDGLEGVDGPARFGRELAALQRVRGPHLVEVLGGETGGRTPWIVTRFVPGRRLDEQVDGRGPLEETALRRLADGLAQGLHVLHRAGVVHRDLSPGNVLMVDGEPQIIDLGLAAFADSALTRTGLLLGTAGYLAPEQVTLGAWSAAVDVHAWGAVVAYAATGRPPFGTGRPDAVLYRVVHDPPDLLGVPAALRGLVTAALDKDPVRRPTPQQLGAGLAALPELVGVGSGPQPVRTGLPTSTADLTALLGPQATSVLADHRPADGGPADPGAQDGGPTRTALLEPRRDDPRPPAPLPPYDARGPDQHRSDQQRSDQHRSDQHRGEPDDRDRAELGPEAAERAGRGGPRWPGWVLGLSALACAVGCGRRAPLLTALAVVLLVLLMTAVTSSIAAGDRRRERRGPRATDRLRSAVSVPWHLVRAAGALLLTSIFWLGVPAVVAGALVLADAPGAAGAVGVGLGSVALLAGPRRRPTRSGFRRAAARLPVLAVLVVAAVLLAVGYAVGQPGLPVETVWWPGA